MLNYIKNLTPKTKKILIAVIAVLLVGAIIAGVYVLSVLKIRSVGIKMVPTKEFEISDIEFYLQNDPLWSNDKIGSSEYTLGGHGCLVTSVSASLGDLGVDLTPQELNSKLSEIDGFENADLLWFKINELLPEIDYKYSRVFSTKTIEKDLESDLMPIVKVRYRGNGIYHWLVVLGTENGEFMVSDPLDSSKAPVPLSNHGGKVYAYRTLVPVG